MKENYVMYRENKVGELKVMRVKGNRNKLEHKMYLKGYRIKLILSLEKLIEAHNLEIWEFLSKYSNYRIDHSYIKNIHFDKFYETYNITEIPTIK